MPDVREKQFQILLAKEKADFLFKMDMEQEEYKGTIVPALMDRKVMRLEDKLRREAMASGSKNQPGDCHGASPLAMTRKGEAV